MSSLSIELYWQGQRPFIDFYKALPSGKDFSCFPNSSSLLSKSHSW